MGSGCMMKPGEDRNRSGKAPTAHIPCPELTVHPLDYIVGSGLCPITGGTVAAGQGFRDAIRSVDLHEDFGTLPVHCAESAFYSAHLFF